MRLPKTWMMAAAGMLSFVAVGCGSDSTNDTTGGNTQTPGQATGGITISGNVISHPLNGLDPNVDFSRLAIAIADPVPLLFNPDAPPLAAAPVTMDSLCSSNKNCAFSFQHVDISNLGLGMLAVVGDTRVGTDRKWVRTATGIAGAATLTALKTSGGPLENVRALAITRATEAAVGAMVGVALGGSPLAAGTLETSGFVVGWALDASAHPVAGATVALVNDSGAALPNIEIWYLADNMQSLNTTATGTSGIFIVRPKTGAGIPLGYVNIAKSGMTWTSTRVGAAGGAALSLNLMATSPAP